MVVHKLRLQDFGFFWPPTPLRLHFLWYECLQKVDILDHLPTESCKHSLWTPPNEDCWISNVEHLGDLVYVWANFFSFGSLCFVLLCSHAPAHYASTAPSTFFSLGTLVSFCLTFLTGHRGKSNLKQICPHQNGGRSETYLKLKKKCMHIDSHVF